MLLKFPNARLSVYNRLLTKRISCVRALVEEAYENGLISQGCLDDLELPGDSCGSAFAARKILEKFFDQRDVASSDGEKQVKVDELWSEIANDLHCYQKRTNLVHELPDDGLMDPMECGNMAPVVMDILLQHLNRYL
jgi:hypothetical protein